MVHIGANGDSKSIIQIRRLAKNYLRGNEELHVLHGIDLDIDQGDFVAFMGPSGSGKILTHLSKAERRKHVETALALVGLADFATRKPRELSGGQQQRVAIARAIVADSTFLLCDEPTGDLDRQSADGILDLLQELVAQHGKTVLMVTHDPRAAERAHATLHLDKGVLST